MLRKVRGSGAREREKAVMACTHLNDLHLRRSRSLSILSSGPMSILGHPRLSYVGTAQKGIRYMASTTNNTAMRPLPSPGLAVTARAYLGQVTKLVHPNGRRPHLVLCHVIAGDVVAAATRAEDVVHP